jgi:hypothetical protein
MLLKILILSFILVIVSFAGLGISMLIKPHGRFPATHISENEALRKKGISCARHNDTGCNPTDENGCSTCAVRRL